LGAARPVERPAPPLEQLRRESRPSRWRVRRSFAWAASIALALGLGYYLRTPSYRAAPAAQTPAQPVAVADNRNAATAEDKARPRASDRRAARPADEIAKVQPRPDSVAGKLADAAALRATDSVSIDARAVSGALARAVRDQPPAPLASIVASAAPARQLPSMTWPVINRRVARSILGEEPVGLPGLATRAFRRAPGTDGTVVVEQAIDSTTVIQIFQRPAYPYDSSGSGRAYASEEQSRERANPRFGRFVRGLRVEITGPLSSDSLNRLLEQVAPLP
jgi:hypothetical protein